MASSTKNVKLGVCNLYYGGVDLGLTKGGVDVEVKTDTHKSQVDQMGKTTINEYIMGRDVTVKAPLAETTIENLAMIMPGAKIATVGGSVATGTITVATNPAAGDTIIVNGDTVTFKVAAATTEEVTLGATAAATAAALATALNASTSKGIAQATYTANGTIITVNYGAAAVYGADGSKTTDGNSFTLGAGTAGVKVTLSGATLSGGQEPTSKSIDVSLGVGIDLLSIARELRLHPVAKAASDKSEDFVIPLAGTAGALKFAYKLEDERVYDTEFNGYPDANSKLFYIGR